MDRFRFFVVIVLIAVASVSMTTCIAAPGYAPQDTADLPDVDAEDSAEADLAEVEEPDAKACGKPMVALTFDDGPSPYTDLILDLLERYGGRATFFVLGRNVEPWQDTIVRAVNLGNEIANHTWTHPELTALNNQAIKAELQNTSDIIRRIAGVSPSFYRPPFGLVNRRVANVSAELGYAIINWTLDTMDWHHRNADLVYNAVMDAVKEGSIVLMHDIHATTAAAMELVIPALIAEGYRLVTVTELLYHLYGEIEPGRVHGIPGIVR